MYTPPAFKEDDPQVLQAILRRRPLATLVSQSAAGLAATHLPLLFRPEERLLLGHLSRANEQWHALEGAPALAIFLGAEGYVSPDWYPSKREHGKVVPTWNYEAVHVYGRVELLQDPGELLALVEALTESQEAGRGRPWAVSDAPEAFVAAQLKGIVGLRLRIERIEGKRKLSQNRPAADRRGVVEGLRAEPAPGRGALAEAMAALEEDQD